MAACLRNETKFKPVKCRLKINLVLHPARAEGLGKINCFCVKLFSLMHKENKERIIQLVTLPLPCHVQN